MGERLIELRDINKSYGNVLRRWAASRCMSTAARSSGLLGDNGAGKSTLIKILAGAVRPSHGEIFVRGKAVSGWSPAASRDAGIETVFQDRALAVQQTIVRNIFMGREITTAFGFLNIAQGRVGGRAASCARSASPQRCSRPTRSSGSSRAASARASPSPARSTTQANLDHPRRADDGAVADRDSEGVPLRAHGARERAARSCSSATTSTTSSTSPSASSCSTAAASRSTITKDEAECAENLDRLHGSMWRIPRRRARWTRSLAEHGQPIRAAGMSSVSRFVHTPSIQLSPGAKFVLGNRASLGIARRVRGDDADLLRLRAGDLLAAGRFYNSVLLTLPVALFLVVPLVFIVTVGERSTCPSRRRWASRPGSSPSSCRRASTRSSA